MRKDLPLAGPRRGTVKPDTQAGPVGAGPAPRDAWDRGELLWYAYYAASLAITLAVVLSAGEPARNTVIAIVLLAVMAGWYAVVGRPLTQTEPHPVSRQAVYLGVLLVLFVLGATQSMASTFILIGVCPQCFFTSTSIRRAMAWVVAFNVTAPVVGLFTVTGAHRGSVLGELAGIAALGIAFSAVFGSWITGIIDQSEDRAALISRLEATQAELAAVSHQAGILAERQRLASEIHDTIAQGFTSIVMLLQAADPEIGRDDAAARRYLASAATAARENLAEARALVAALAPAQLQSGSLDDALGRLAERTGTEFGLPATFEVSGRARPLPAVAEVVLLRVCQEALANVRQHAQADRAWVRLGYEEAVVRLEVGDDGAGFDLDRVNGGFGLRGMRARVGEGGGTLVVRSAPGAGTSVRVEVPT
jgi:signal transduction histidine kinase